MRIKDLITQLTDFDPELEVVFAIDEEGNGYRGDLWVTPGHLREGYGEIEFTSYELDEDGDEIYPEVDVTVENATAVCIG